MTVAVPITKLFKRSTLGLGSYVIREDEKCAIPYEAPQTILDAVITNGACVVRHSGMFDKTEQATALPGGYIYEVVSKYSSRGLPERTWVIGTTAVRHIMRLLDFSAPVKLLPGESHVPADAELISEWDEFASREQLSRIGASLGALHTFKEARYARDKDLHNGLYEPVTLPVGQTAESQPSRPGSMFDPRRADSAFWTMYSTRVRTASGTYELHSDGKLGRV